jgi:hypothetical protein
MPGIRLWQLFEFAKPEKLRSILLSDALRANRDTWMNRSDRSGGVAGISRDSAPQSGTRFTRSAAPEDQFHQSTFPTTKDDK